jgi:hypothetical protein
MSVIWVLVIIAIVAYAAEKRRQAKGALDLPSQVTSLEQKVAELRSLVDELRGTRPEGAAAAQPALPPEPARPAPRTPARAPRTSGCRTIRAGCDCWGDAPADAAAVLQPSIEPPDV